MHQKVPIGAAVSTCYTAGLKLRLADKSDETGSTSVSDHNQLSRRLLVTGGASGLAAATLLRTAKTQEATPEPSVQLLEPLADPVALGMMVEVVENRARLDATIDMIGRDLAVVMFHTHWGTFSGNFDQSLLEYVSDRGAVPLVTWEAWQPFYAGGVPVADQPVFALSNVLSGAFDEYIDSWANGLTAYGLPVLLRWGHEMNGDWYPWAVGVNSNTSESFVRAWQYIHDRFDEAGATNVQWVWSPIAGSIATNRAANLDLASIYPGDEYVDWIGLSGFNWGTTVQPWGVDGWKTFSQIFFASYTRLTGLADKPIIVAEVASTEEGGDKAGWITSAMISELPERFPQIRAFVWFNILKETDWRVESSPESLRAFVAAASTPYLQGSIAD
jgi:hypothetical protein